MIHHNGINFTKIYIYIYKFDH